MSSYIQKIGAEKNKIFLLAVSALVVAYLSNAMFNLPYMTMDEVGWLTKSGLKESLDEVISFGRAPQVIMVLINHAIDFDAPTFPRMIPRFLCVLFLCYSIYNILLSMHWSRGLCAYCIGLFILTHQLDWQHNGLIAFFSIYSLYLASYLAAINNSLWSENFSPIRLLLFIVSFSNELFIILALVYLLASVIILGLSSLKNKAELLVALIVVAILYLCVSQLASEELSKGMDNYLFGALGGYSYVDLFKAGSLYLIFSIPYLENINPSSAVELVIFIIIVYLSSIFFRRYWSMHKKDTNKSQIFLYSINIVLMGILPQYLMAAQPIKVDWILTGASHRYAFSLYGWLFILIVMIQLVSDKWLGLSYFNRLVIVTLTLIVSGVTLSKNLSFISEYETSLQNWQDIHQAAKDDGDVVRINPKWLKHPHILPVNSEQVESIIYNQYRKRSILVDSLEPKYSSTLAEGIDFTKEGYPDFLASVDGVSHRENWGRWTDGPRVVFKFKNILPKDFRIELTARAFGPNINNPLEIRVGNKIEKLKLTSNADRTYSTTIRDASTDTLVLLPAVPISPKSLGVNDDLRLIGVGLTNLKIMQEDW